MVVEYGEVSLHAVSIGVAEKEFLVEAAVRDETPRHICHNEVVMVVTTLTMLMMLVHACGSSDDGTIGAR